MTPVEQPGHAVVSDAAPAAELGQVVDALGAELVAVLAVPNGLSVAVSDVVILDPEDPDEASAVRARDLLLVVGARGAAAAPAVRAAGRAGAAGVAVKGAATATALAQAAEDAGVALLDVPRQARWEQVRSLAGGVVEAAKASGESLAGELLGDLFSLAQTTAALTGGFVTIEDTSSRVLAYSTTGDEVDELRRLSILGRQGPERYLAMLRDWGVFRRLRAGEGVVHVAEHPELGIRRRIAAGIHAGSQPLGTIWVQEGTAPLAEQADHALLGAARTAALHLVRRRTGITAGLRLREDLLAGLLDGRLDARSVAGDIGARADRPAVVVAFALRTPAGTAASDRSELELDLAELVNLIAVHAAAYRRSALVSALGSRLYALLPDLPEGGVSGADGGALGLAREVVSAAGRHLDAEVWAGVGGVVDGLAGSSGSRGDADRVLDAMVRDTATSAGGTWPERIASLTDVRSAVLFSELLALLTERPRLRDPRIRVLAEYDAGHAGALVPSVLAYLDAFADVRSAARALHVHPNTLRYRIRRAAEVSGVDLDDPRQRILAQLQLRLPE